ncbi:Very Large A-Kinase Anchor Protein, partial [Manis pentadactyla]
GLLQTRIVALKLRPPSLPGGKRRPRPGGRERQWQLLGAAPSLDLGPVRQGPRWVCENHRPPTDPDQVRRRRWAAPRRPAEDELTDPTANPKLGGQPSPGPLAAATRVKLTLRCAARVQPAASESAKNAPEAPTSGPARTAPFHSPHFRVCAHRPPSGLAPPSVSRRALRGQARVDNNKSVAESAALPILGQSLGHCSRLPGPSAPTGRGPRPRSRPRVEGPDGVPVLADRLLPGARDRGRHSGRRQLCWLAEPDGQLVAARRRKMKKVLPGERCRYVPFPASGNAALGAGTPMARSTPRAGAPWPGLGPSLPPCVYPDAPCLLPRLRSALGAFDSRNWEWNWAETEPSAPREERVASRSRPRPGERGSVLSYSQE